MAKHLGLNLDEVSLRQKNFGLNILSQKEGPFWFGLLFNQFKSPLIYILLAVGLISLILSEYINSALIFGVLVVNVIMGFYQEFSAQKTLKALKNLIKPKAFVIRGGQRFEIEAKNLVPGDIVLLGSGDKISADGKLIETADLIVNEAILTGEEEAILKSLNSGNVQVFMGTTVLSGRGIMEVEKIGQMTEMGKISQSLSEIKDEETPLQIKLNQFTKTLVWIILTVCLLIFLIGISQHENFWEMLEISIILSIAAIPEALPISLTVILALGMRKILKRHGLVKKLLSIETLGSTSVICTDKTGTLTEGKMQVITIDTKDKEKIIQAMALVNEQKSNIELAMWEYVKKIKNPQEVYDLAPRVDEEPFDSEKKYALSINTVDGKNIAYLNGAPEIIASFCDLSEDERSEIFQKIDQLAGDGLRLLGSSYKIEGDLKEKRNFKWLGLIGIEDPVRPEAKAAIEEAQKSGIKIKIITGDYRKTAERVANNLGLKIEEKNIIDGENLEKITDDDLKSQIDDLVLFCRVSPHQKLKIVKALQEKGEVVAMTGDGVNDAPALKKADIGVVVGTATEVAKETGDLILLDNNFQTIVAACEEGRLILANIKKVVGYVLSNAFAEIILIFGAMILNYPVPLIIVQILWIHLICDGPPDILLGFEPKEAGIMEQNPKEIKNDKILNNATKLLILIISATIGLSSLILFSYFEKTTGDIVLARTIAFATVGVASLVYIFSFKDLKKSIFQIKLFQNKLLILGVIYGFLLILIAIYVPFFNKILETVPLNIFQWFWVSFAAIFVTFLTEVLKYIKRKIIQKKNDSY